MMLSKIIAACLLTVCGAIAAEASSASAALPELGRCVKVTGVVEGKRTHYNGAYTNKTCTHVSESHKGKFEWEPGPGEKNKFFSFGTEPEPTLETVGGAKVGCSTMAFQGAEYTGPKTATVKKVVFTGCEEAGVPCQTIPTQNAEIEGSEFTMELGVISAGAKPVVGWDLKKEGDAFLFECGKLPELRSTQTLEGSVIGALKAGATGDVNHMSILAPINYRESAGKQLPEAFEGGVKDTLTNTTITESLSKTTEQAGVTATMELESGTGEKGIEPENQEPLEVKTIG